VLKEARALLRLGTWLCIASKPCSPLRPPSLSCKTPEPSVTIVYDTINCCVLNPGLLLPLNPAAAFKPWISVAPKPCSLNPAAAFQRNLEPRPPVAPKPCCALNPGLVLPLLNPKPYLEDPAHCDGGGAAAATLANHDTLQTLL